MREYLTFRKMITPVFIQVIFWLAVAVLVIAGLARIADDAPVEGIALIVLGPLAARIYAEILMVIFRINDNVAALRDGRAGGAAPHDVA